MDVSSFTTKIPHPTTTKFYDESGDEELDYTNEFPLPDAKRRRFDVRKSGQEHHAGSPSQEQSLGGHISHGSPSRTRSRISTTKDEIPDSEDEGFDRYEDHIRTSELETALPPVQTDEEAIEAYEAYKASQSLENGNGETIQSRMENMTWTKGRSSIYVDAFNHALNTVLEDEEHLFNEAEKAVFQHWRELDYESQYLYVRLFLRKTSAWFRIGRLGYYGDVSDMDGAVYKLRKERDLPEMHEEATIFPGESVLSEEAIPLGNKFTFAESSDEHINSLDEASSLLLLEELKAIAKDAKVNGKNKSELLRNLRRTSGKQSGLGFIKRSETEESVDSVGTESGLETNADGTMTPNSNRDAHFTRKILDQTGKCIRLSLVPLKLFERVHLVFYRSTEWTDKSLTTLILAKISRRNFPDYIVSRSATIFESRSFLLEFEASLRTQFRVDNILEFSNLPVQKQIDEIKNIFDAVYPRWKVLLRKEQEKEDRVYETGEGAYLRRFSPAWVYTRIVHKGLWPFARFKDHKREHELLTELLGQRLFHAARRGVWYQRKALLEEHYMYALTNAESRTEEANKKHWKRVALQTCEQGLQDNECHVIYHYDLQKRVIKLEKQLRLPKREQHIFSHVGLKMARERDVYGIQILRDREKTPPATARTVRRRDSSRGSKERERDRSPEKKKPTTSSASTNATNSIGNRRGAKTIWLDPLDDSHDDYVSVESMCLSYYRHTLGFKGYHSEGGILRILFGLLFYDVLFQTYVPNVFQTPYQTCPLDLHTDAFYSVRISEINSRINELANEQGEKILRQIWTEHTERKTCIVGVRWDEYELEDLCELVRCFGGDALGVVMRVMAQEYQDRGGGVPDLILWKTCNAEDKDQKEQRHQQADTGKSNEKKKKYGKVMFAEVKSENDRLSDTQRLWISVLLNAGVEVELCHAIASETRVVE